MLISKGYFPQWNDKLNAPQMWSILPIFTLNLAYFMAIFNIYIAMYNKMSEEEHQKMKYFCGLFLQIRK